MLHPVFKSTLHLTAYWLVWLLLAAGHFFIIRNFYAIPFATALTDSLVFNLMYGGLGLGFWYVVRFSHYGHLHFFRVFINHLVTGLVAVMIWLMFGYFLVKSMVHLDVSYQLFFRDVLPWRLLMGFSFYTILVLIYYLSIYYQNLQDKTVREASLQASVKEAELNVLKSQLNPHFIFNSLNSISSLTMTAPEKAQDMVIKLSEFLRYSLHQKQNRITTLKQELQSLKLYLDIEKIRFGERLCLQENIPEDCLQQQLPHMLLQPIFENAIKHGVYESTEPVLITVDGACEPALLTLKISNTYDPEAVARKGEGVGLNNVKNRLRLVYGGGELLKIHKTDRIFTVTLLIPQNHADKSTDH